MHEVMPPQTHATPYEYVPIRTYAVLFEIHGAMDRMAMSDLVGQYHCPRFSFGAAPGAGAFGAIATAAATASAAEAADDDGGKPSTWLPQPILISHRHFPLNAVCIACFLPALPTLPAPLFILGCPTYRARPACKNQHCVCLPTMIRRSEEPSHTHMSLYKARMQAHTSFFKK